ncbi:type II toxin-antitoxin system RelE/ParE family toxin [Subtercola vilae]|uniref:Type II toxin-antitoxin system RelE/ParE family toxin n=1 Tax=Subtercola vilae TaxID=2056433 RepID=A0A4T2BLE3_9MICO|nr:type II toxin-antitoxin system RelE/ParE family toxin [Subtercola vilae]TIH29838.1 type II toxin-antitoxin system RelE/ParE family toxin [Subtercola vilae]
MQWTVEFSEEVREWYVALSPEGKAATQRIVARLEIQAHMLGMPHSRTLGDGLRELRFTCEGVARRITYVLDPGRKAVTLTTFRKQRNNERGEVLRARRAQAKHETEHQDEAPKKRGKNR